VRHSAIRGSTSRARVRRSRGHRLFHSRRQRRDSKKRSRSSSRRAQRRLTHPGLLTVMFHRHSRRDRPLPTAVGASTLERFCFARPDGMFAPGVSRFAGTESDGSGTLQGVRSWSAEAGGRCASPHRCRKSGWHEMRVGCTPEMCELIGDDVEGGRSHRSRVCGLPVEAEVLV